MWNVHRPQPEVIDSPAKVSALQEKLRYIPLAALDTETTGIEYDSHVLFWSLSTGDDRYFLERKHLETFRSVLEDPDRVWILHNAKFDAHMLANAGIRLGGDWCCTMVMDHLLDADERHGLKDIYEREFSEPVLDFKDTFPKKHKESEGEALLRCWEENPQKVINYASLDAWMTYRLYDHFRDKLDQIKTWRGSSLFELFLTQEVPFTRVLFDMERRGVLVDTGYLTSLIPAMEEDLDRIVRRLSKVSGQLVNPASPQQVARLLYDRLGHRPASYTDKGAASTDKAALEPLAALGCEEAKLILEHRATSKMLGTYIKGLLNSVAADGLVHTQYNQATTRTGRLSSTEPNLQNIPRPDSDKYKLRQAFCARPGHTFLCADYDQLELYIMTHYSQDETLLAAIHAGRDLHAATAAEVWGVPYEDIIAAKKKKEGLTEYDLLMLTHRQHVKKIGFGLSYGKQERSLAEDLGFPEKIHQEHPNWDTKKIFRLAKQQAAEVKNRYFEKIPGVKDYIAFIQAEAGRRKYVETWSGRRRWLRGVMHPDDIAEHTREAKIDAIRAGYRNINVSCWCERCRDSRQGERQAINTPIQGTAADITQGAMLRIARDQRLDCVSMVLQVHDELGIEVPTELLDEVTPLIRHHLENPGFTDFRVPLRASIGTGPNWMEAK